MAVECELCWNSEEDSALFGIAEADRRLADAERLIEERCVRDPAEEAERAMAAAAEELRHWTAESEARIEAARRATDAEVFELHELESALEEAQARLRTSAPDTRDANAVAGYNRSVAEFNTRAARQRELTAACRSSLEAFNRLVGAHNKDLEARQLRSSQAQQTARKKYEEYRAWHQAHGAESLWRQVNALYAEAWREWRGKAAPAAYGRLERLRAARGTLGRRAMEQREGADTSVLAVPVRLGECEECCLVVDTGASLVTVSPEVVEALGLTSRTGEAIEVSLAGGLRTKGPRLTLPAVTVQGLQARDVDAVVLPESTPGVDGLLGMSFLGRFDFELSDAGGTGARGLVLRPKTQTAGPHEIAIECSAEAEWWAGAVAGALAAKGYRPVVRVGGAAGGTISVAVPAVNPILQAAIPSTGKQR